jgi:hypothetical protein
MITKKTVFILGAGASVAYGYPTGFELREEIRKFLANFPENERCPKDQIGHLNFFKELGYEPKDLKKFEQSLLRSGTYSIDKFLEQRDDCVELGKILIAYILKRKELPSMLFTNLKERNWYAELFNRLDSNIDNINTHQLSFITFNYDRSLEFFLYSILKERTTKEEDYIVKAFKFIPIIHVYGTFGNFPWSAGKKIDYSAEVTPENVIAMANGINIMSEERRTEELEKAHELIKCADSIYIIGFGYDNVNLDRLCINKYGYGKNIVGMSFGLSERKIQNAEYFISRSQISGSGGETTSSGCHIKFCKNNCTIMEFLENYVQFI